MITNFEDITRELSDDELMLIPILEKGFKRHGANNPVKGPDIVKGVNAYAEKIGLPVRMTEARLRKCCNYIRSKSILPVIATSNGYFVSDDHDVIAKQILSLQERAAAIMACAKGLQRFLPQP